jgi:hypothetical protein
MPPGFLNRRECLLQSQPHALQYHTVMPSHSSRLAATARPSSIRRWSDGVIGPWITGTTALLPHSGHDGIRFDGFLAPDLRGMDVIATSDRRTQCLNQSSRFLEGFPYLLCNIDEQLCFGVRQLAADRHQTAIGSKPEIVRLYVFQCSAHPVNH